MNWITEPLQYPFMQSALITGLAVSIVCALLSCYLVLKGWSLMGDAISHAVLPGVVLSSLFAIPLFIGAFISGLACAVLTGYIKEHSRLKEDTVMGIVFSGMFAIGLVMFTHVETDQHLMHILFGNILGIPEDLMWQTLFVCAAVAVTTLLFYKDLLMVCFDKSHARVVGLNIRALHYLLLILIALVTVAAIQVVGVVLVVAMLVGPGVVALMLSRRFEVMMLVATLVSVFSTLTGVVISYHIDGSTSACIVLVQAVLFIAAFSGKQLSPQRGMAKIKLSTEPKV